MDESKLNRFEIVFTEGKERLVFGFENEPDLRIKAKDLVDSKEVTSLSESPSPEQVDLVYKNTVNALERNIRRKATKKDISNAGITKKRIRERLKTEMKAETAEVYFKSILSRTKTEILNLLTQEIK